MKNTVKIENEEFERQFESQKKEIFAFFSSL